MERNDNEERRGGVTRLVSIFNDAITIIFVMNNIEMYVEHKS